MGDKLEVLKVEIQGTVAPYKKALAEAKAETKNAVAVINSNMSKAGMVNPEILDELLGNVKVGMNQARIETKKAAESMKEDIDSVNKEASKMEESMNESTGRKRKPLFSFDTNGIIQKIRDMQKRIRDAISSATSGAKGKIKNYQMDAGIKKQTDEFLDLESKIEKTEVTLEKYYSRLAKMESLGVKEDSREWKSVEYEIAKAEGQLARYQKRRDKMVSSGSDVERTVPIPKQFGNLFKTIGSKGWGGVTKIFGGLRSVLSKVSPVIKKTGGAFAALIQKFVSGIPHINRLNNSMRRTGRTGRQMGGIFRTLGMTARFMFASFLIRGALNGAKEGMQNLAQYSGQTNGSLSLLMSSLTQLKNALATAFAPILNVVAPLLNGLIQKVIQSVSALGMLFASLTGQKTFTAAKRVNQDYAASLNNNAKSADKANKSNQELQKTLLGIDQINKLNDSSDTGASDTGSEDLGGLTPADMFEEVAIFNGINDLADKIKEAWRNADFTEIGQIIGNKLNKALESIPWDNIRNTLNKVAKSVATFLNGFIEAVDWKLVGATLSKGVNTVFEAANTFAKNFHWGSLGIAVSNGINGAINKLDWDLIKETVRNVASGLIDALNNFIANAEWEKIGKTITEYFNAKLEFFYTAVTDFKWKELGQSLGDMLNGAIKAADFNKAGITLGRAVSGVVSMIRETVKKTKWNKLAKDFANGLNTAVKEIDIPSIGDGLAEVVNSALSMLKKFIKTFKWKTLGKEISTGVSNAITGIKWEDVWKTLSEAVKGILDFLIGLVQGINWKELGKTIVKAILDFLTKTNWGSILKKIGELGLALVQGLLEGILSGVKEIGEWLKENLVDPIIDNVKEFFGIHSPSTVFKEIGSQLLAGMLNGLIENVTKIISWFKDLPGRIKDALGNAKEWLRQKGKDAIEGLKNGWESVKETKLGKTVSAVGKYVKDKAGDAKSWVKEKGSAAIEGIRNGWESVKDMSLGNAVSKIGGYVNAKIGNIKSAVTNKGKDIIEGVKNGYENSKQSGLLQKVSSLKENVFSAIGNVSSKVKSKGSDIVSGIKGGFESKKNTLQRSVSKIPNMIASGIGDLFSIGRDAISSFADGFLSIDIPLPHIKTSWNRHYIGNTSFSTPSFGISWYEKGGFPGMGEMFIARENGPELVGKMGNHAAVANNGQIVEGIESGVFKAVMDAFNASGYLGKSNNETPVYIEFTMKCGEETLYRSLKKGEEKYNGRFMVLETV